MTVSANRDAALSTGQLKTRRRTVAIAVVAERLKLSRSPEERESFARLQSSLGLLLNRTRLILCEPRISPTGHTRLTVDGAGLACITFNS